MGTRLFRMLPTLTVCCAMLGFVWIAWSAYQESTQAPINQLPLVTAEEGSIKHKPEDEGGMKIPHQDKEIYSAITDTKQKDTVETLLPQAETPMAKRINVDDALLNQGKRVIVDDELKKGKTIVVDESLTTVKTVDVDEELKAKENQSETQGNKTGTLTKITAVPTFKPTPPKSAESTAASPSSQTFGEFMVQLAAYKSDAEAKQAWDKIRSKHNALQGLTSSVQKANVGGATYYRLRAGYFTTREKADALCDTLKAAQQGCFVVR